MYGSKSRKKRQNNPNNKYNKGVYWQGWCHISNKSLRRQLRQTAEDVPSGNFYRKIGTWFEWN